MDGLQGLCAGKTLSLFSELQFSLTRNVTIIAPTQSQEGSIHLIIMIIVQSSLAAAQPLMMSRHRSRQSRATLSACLPQAPEPCVWTAATLPWVSSLHPQGKHHHTQCRTRAIWEWAQNFTDLCACMRALWQREEPSSTAHGCVTLGQSHHLSEPHFSSSLKGRES